MGASKLLPKAPARKDLISNMPRGFGQRGPSRPGGFKGGRPPSESPYDEKVVQVNRVSKKTKGGNRIGFSVLMVVGDKKGKVGVGLGKAPSVIAAIKKGAKRAKKSFVKIPMKGTTIPYEVTVKLGAAKILLKPAPPGTGVIAGGAVRAVVEAAGVRDIVSKILGTKNKASNVYATFAALQKIKTLSSKYHNLQKQTR